MNYEKAGEILKSFLDQEQLRKGSRYAAFFRSWERVAGGKIAAHSRITDIRGNQLLVEADHPGWVQMIQMQRELILKRTARLFPELGIDSMLIRLRRKDAGENEAPEAPPESADPEDRGEETPDETDPPETEDSPESEDTPLAKIRDRQLRGLLERLERGIRDRGTKNDR